MTTYTGRVGNTSEPRLCFNNGCGTGHGKRTFADIF